MPVSSGSLRRPNITVGRLSSAPPEYLLAAVLMVGFAGLAALSGLTRLVPVPNTIVQLLDVGTEANVWTWANVLVLSYAALGHAACGCVRWLGGVPQARAWLASAVVMIAFSLDDFVSLHERTEALGLALGGGGGLAKFAWVIPGIALCLVCVAALAPLMRQADRVPRRMMIAGTASLFLGAIGLEAVSGYSLSRRGHDVTYDVLMHSEELLEALGATLFLCAAVADLRGRKELLMRVVMRSISRTP